MKNSNKDSKKRSSAKGKGARDKSSPSKVGVKTGKITKSGPPNQFGSSGLDKETTSTIEFDPSIWYLSNEIDVLKSLGDINAKIGSFELARDFYNQALISLHTKGYKFDEEHAPESKSMKIVKSLAKSEFTSTKIDQKKQDFEDDEYSVGLMMLLEDVSQELHSMRTSIKRITEVLEKSIQ